MARAPWDRAARRPRAACRLVEELETCTSDCIVAHPPTGVFLQPPGCQGITNHLPAAFSMEGERRGHAALATAKGAAGIGDIASRT